MAEPAMRVDDRQLTLLLRDLEPGQRLRSVRAGFRKGATAMRREVIRQLRSVRRSNRTLEKGVRAIVYRKTAGFRVTVGTSGRGPGAKGYYWSKGNRREVPVLCWTDTGTDMRFTRGTARRCVHYTGRLEPPGMIIDNAVKAKGDEVTRDVMDGIERSCLRAAMRYGCR